MNNGVSASTGEFLQIRLGLIYLLNFLIISHQEANLSLTSGSNLYTVAKVQREVSKIQGVP